MSEQGGIQKDALIAKHTKLALEGGKATSQESYYTNRSRIAEVAGSFIEQKLQEKKGGKIRILEIGTGEGKAIEALLDKYPNQLEITATSLTPFDSHNTLAKKGVSVKIGVPIEELPQEWNGSYDMVLTDSVLCWSRIPKAMQNILQVLSSGGIWCGLESSSGLSEESPFRTKEQIDMMLKGFVKGHKMALKQIPKDALARLRKGTYAMAARKM